ncbi:MerR family transcriptional regulator [Acidaminobacter sp. JC074]|uniref:MerR family transcriptional regulator n=1 Tax=Acidaminobacter sp. JC074 TaxID=2530199 RepID=UPI001F0F83BF|nr:MerR family transcriptional regulator [Acidaminobacter sp. JC074]MCH4886198.1 MerR family transcriptional regulator [Acidaminobacter sp. JC074]
MLINDVSKKYQISTRTLRYYESIGLYDLSRNENGIRLFSHDKILILEEILLYKSIGLPLKSIKGLLDKSLSLKEVLKDRLSQTDDDIQRLQYYKSIMESILKTSGSKEIHTSTLDAFLKEQIYLKEERWLYMTQKNITIDIGNNLIPIALKENTPNILTSIHEFRLDFHEVYGKPFELIRIKDNPDLEDDEYQILISDHVVHKASLSDLSPIQQIDIILSQLKALLLK